MSKIQFVVASPVDTFSGYGTMSRAFIKALIKTKKDEWDIKLMSLGWGNTPFGALDVNNPEDAYIKSLILPNNTMQQQPDVWIQISVANEFQTVGKVNIGYTCMVETNTAPAEMMEGLNKMNFNLASSEHAKRIVLETKWDKLDNNKRKIGELTNQKPIETLFLGLDTDKFKKPEVNDFDLSMIKEEFCFLSVGHFLPGVHILEDRKMMGRLIQSFLETFKNKKNRPALILKASMGVYSHVDEEQTLKAISVIKDRLPKADYPNIYLIHGELTEEELCKLYCHDKVKAFALVGNEGFGLPYIEFSAVSGKPIIASPWSGHVDFLEKEFNVFVNGQLDKVNPAVVNNFIVENSVWFKPDMGDLSFKLNMIYEDYSKFVDAGKRQGYRSRTQYTIDAMANRLGEILDKHLPKISVPTPVKLPKLKSFSAPEDLVEIK